MNRMFSGIRHLSLRASHTSFALSGGSEPVAWRTITAQQSPLCTGSVLALTAGTISMLCALVFFLFLNGLVGFMTA